MQSRFRYVAYMCVYIFAYIRIYVYVWCKRDLQLWEYIGSTWEQIQIRSIYVLIGSAYVFEVLEGVCVLCM